MHENTDQIKLCMARFDKIDAKLEELNGRLFIDNGETSLQSKVNKNTNRGRILIAIITPVALVSIKVLIEIIQHVMIVS